jgi:hypothetical protein
MDEVVDIAADLIVRHLKARPKSEKPEAQKEEAES